jgi:hypothetical protein
MGALPADTADYIKKILAEIDNGEHFVSIGFVS